MEKRESTLYVENPILLVGEIVVDHTSFELGGIVHPALDLWARNVPYAIAAVCSSDLLDQARRYLFWHDCADFVWLGEMQNATVCHHFADVSQKDDENLTRAEKKAKIRDVGQALFPYREVVIFPGDYCLMTAKRFLAPDARLSFDLVS